MQVALLPTIRLQASGDSREGAADGQQGRSGAAGDAARGKQTSATGLAVTRLERGEWGVGNGAAHDPILRFNRDEAVGFLLCR